MNYRNFIILGIIIIAICLFFKRRYSTIETFKPKLGLAEAGALNEWNQNAAAHLCEMPLDYSDAKEKGFIVSFCNRMIRETDYNNFSFLAVDKPST